MQTSKSSVFVFIAFGLFAATLLATSATAKKDSNEEVDAKKDKEKFYKKRDLERITQLMAEISELLAYLQYEQSFLTELLISSFSLPKPEVKVENFKEAAKNLTKTLDKFYTRNTLSGRPAKMVTKHLEKHPFHLTDVEGDE